MRKAPFYYYKYIVLKILVYRLTFKKGWYWTSGSYTPLLFFCVIVKYYANVDDENQQHQQHQQQHQHHQQQYQESGAATNFNSNNYPSCFIPPRRRQTQQRTITINNINNNNNSSNKLPRGLGYTWRMFAPPFHHMPHHPYLIKQVFQCWNILSTSLVRYYHD